MVYADRFKEQYEQINFLQNELTRVKDLVRKFLTPDQLGQIGAKAQTPATQEDSIRQGESELVNSTSVHDSRSQTVKNSPKRESFKFTPKIEHSDVHQLY